MKTIVAGRVAVTATEFIELALGIDLELFTGSPTESVMDRAARLDVAREVLADLRESDPEAAAYAESLMRALPLKEPRPCGRRTRHATSRRPLHERAAVTA
ncbi:hypothetical protein [Streptomyces fulvorobeus]|uniref:Uncharacterized protein n=1 Tax=Streptomyces fulvorobeus TaxID=284028 RepID=A0A7J0CA68_9ACTN|nr:hypothetical protein [Streptomyces fulvorobeus]NYE42387.1 hypothetical protein [Streptomyces fulvorobeus]GFM98783.1 hypothetical protein Sfulv_35940 [Streptomyces fulvorobeus]